MHVFKLKECQAELVEAGIRTNKDFDKLSLTSANLNIIPFYTAKRKSRINLN